VCQKGVGSVSEEACWVGCRVGVSGEMRRWKGGELRCGGEVVREGLVSASALG